AAIPYTAIDNASIEVSESEIKALYNKKKETFEQLVETRNIKYIDVLVTPSEADRQEVLSEVTDAALQLASPAEISTFIRSTGSVIPFSPIAINKTVFPNDIATRLDSVGINEVYGPYYNQADDSYNAFKVIAKTTLPDSIEFRQIQVSAENETKTAQLADSILNALKGGADFGDIAVKYGQTGEANWLTASSYEGAELESEYVRYINTLIETAPKAYTNFTMPQGSVVLQVLNKKAMQTKYQVAVVKRPVEFSKETYNQAYNNFSQFVAQNTTLSQIAENAEENGYRLLDRNDFYSAEHRVGGVRGTRDALKWIFEAKEGQVSPLYECGENDHLMVVALEKINPAGYRNINSVADALRSEIIKDKKAEKLMAQLKGADVAKAKEMENAVSDTVKHITFAAPAFVSVTRGSEPALGAYASKAKQGEVSEPIKGNSAVYVVQVLEKQQNAETFDAKAEEMSQVTMSARYASNFINDLYKKAKVKDTRYLYF
ncbi:MAG: foldase protein PrsA, partial [Phocaeicola sp.]